MTISYAICVCNEHKELYDLLTFLHEVKRPNDEIVILRDENFINNKDVSTILVLFPDTKVIYREFNRDFAEHKNYLTQHCSGDYIFNIDADEIPQETLIRTVEKMTEDKEPPDLLWVPRINICPGYTQNFLKKHKFSCNPNGWINWPDYQGRVYQKHLKWEGKVHEKIEGAKKSMGLPENGLIALWHIKSTTKQTNQNKLYDEII